MCIQFQFSSQFIFIPNSSTTAMRRQCSVASKSYPGSTRPPLHSSQTLLLSFLRSFALLQRVQLLFLNTPSSLLSQQHTHTHTVKHEATAHNSTEYSRIWRRFSAGLANRRTPTGDKRPTKPHQVDREKQENHRVSVAFEDYRNDDLIARPISQ